jgi:hypothetical protein
MADTENSLNETSGIPEIDYEVEVFGMTQAEVDKTLTIEDCAADAKATGQAIANVASDLSEDELDAFGLMYPIGSIYVSMNSTAPTFTGTYWQEVIPTATVTQLKNDEMDFVPGEGTGTVHYWQRIAEPTGGEGT